MEQQAQKFFNFAQKLSIILQDPRFSSYIQLKQDGSFVQIKDSLLFQSQVLPFFFRHDKLDSFFKQMNSYGFKKIRNMPYHTFFHPKLQKGSKISELLNAKKQVKQQKKRRYKLKKEMKQKLKTQKKYKQQQIALKNRKQFIKIEQKNQFLHTNKNNYIFPSFNFESQKTFFNQSKQVPWYLNKLTQGTPPPNSMYQ